MPNYKTKSGYVFFKFMFLRAFGRKQTASLVVCLVPYKKETSLATIRSPYRPLTSLIRRQVELSSSASLSILWIVFTLVSCSTEPSNKSNQTAEVFGETLKPRYAKGFEIRESEGTVELLLFNLEKPGDTLEIISLPKQHSELPLSACLSTTHLPFMLLLGLENQVSACGNAAWVRTPAFKQRIESHQILNLTSGDALDVELLIASKARFLFTYPFGDTYIDNKKIPDVLVIPISEYLEEHPLGRAEWIKVFGAIYGKSEEAAIIFSNIENAYNEVRANCMGDSNVVSPKVLTASVQGDRWFIPPGNSYIGHLISDAGGDYMFSDSVSAANYSFDQEGFFDKLMKAEIYTEVTMDSSLHSYEKLVDSRPLFGACPCVKNKTVFICNSLQSDYFGYAVVEPHLLIKDLAAAIHPELYPKHISRYFAALDSEKNP